MSNSSIVAETAARHNLSRGAVQALADGLARSGGGSAQWNHPDLGGMGQWFAGGMLQIGDMFNNDLKARVGAALDDLARAGTAARDTGGAGQGASRSDTGSGPAWWPENLGQPSSSGAQNDMRYACFPEARRLAVRRNGDVTVYDTGARRLTGFSQSQAGSQSLEFSGPDGPVTLADLDVVAQARPLAGRGIETSGGGAPSQAHGSNVAFVPCSDDPGSQG